MRHLARQIADNGNAGCNTQLQTLAAARWSELWCQKWSDALTYCLSCARGSTHLSHSCGQRHAIGWALIGSCRVCYNLPCNMLSQKGQQSCKSTIRNICNPFKIISKNKRWTATKRRLVKTLFSTMITQTSANGDCLLITHQVDLLWWWYSASAGITATDMPEPFRYKFWTSRLVLCDVNSP